MAERKRSSFENEKHHKSDPKKLKELEQEEEKASEEEEDDDTCNKQLPCGTNHLCQKDKGHPGECGDCTNVRKYLQKCGHFVVEKCHYRNVSKIPPRLCYWTCETLQVCGHNCQRCCYACDGKCAPVLCDVCQWTREQQATAARRNGAGPSGSSSRQQQKQQPLASTFQSSLNLSSGPPDPNSSTASTSTGMVATGRKSPGTDSAANEGSADLDLDAIIGTTDSESEGPGIESPSGWDEDEWPEDSQEVFIVSD